MPSGVEGHVLLHPGLFRPAFEIDTKVAFIGQSSEHKAVGRAVPTFRQPFHGLGRKGDIDGMGGLRHHHRHAPLSAGHGEVTPAQLPDVADTQPAETGEQVCLPYLLVKERRGHHPLYFLNGQEIPLAFGNFDFLGHFQPVPRVRGNQVLADGLVQCGAQSRIIGMRSLRRYRLAPYGLAGTAEPVDIVKIELLVHITELDIRTKFQQVLAGVVNTVQVTRSPVLVVLTNNRHPVGQQHVGGCIFRHRFHLRVKQGFRPLTSDVFRHAECPRVLPLRLGGCLRHEIELQELVLVPAVHATVKKQG